MTAGDTLVICSLCGHAFLSDNPKVEAATFGEQQIYMFCCPPCREIVTALHEQRRLNLAALLQLPGKLRDGATDEDVAEALSRAHAAMAALGLVAAPDDDPAPVPLRLVE